MGSVVLDRRRFLKLLSSAPLAIAACAGGGVSTARVPAAGSAPRALDSERVIRIDSANAARRALLAARDAGRPVAIAGGRHASGGQQFLARGWLLDMRDHGHVRDFDPGRRTVTVDAGMQWPELLDFLSATRDASGAGLTIAQKQLGADRISLGGSLAANAHGCGLAHPPMVEDVERFMLMDADGREEAIDRTANLNLFRLAIGGYGLVGLVTEVTLRLVERRKVERLASMERADDAAAMLDERARDGHLLGRMLLATDPADFLGSGILTTYRPVPPETPIPPDQRILAPADWRALRVLAHRDPAEASRAWARHYLETNGQVDWADDLQRSAYQEGAHEEIDRELGGEAGGSETSVQLQVPPVGLADFLASAREILRSGGAPVVEASVKLVEADLETFLPWARERYACVTFDLHVDPSPSAVATAGETCRRLIDAALERGGTFYLTYDRFADRARIEAAYPRFPEFLRLKRVIDPAERFQSDWYRRVVMLFAGR